MVTIITATKEIIFAQHPALELYLSVILPIMGPDKAYPTPNAIKAYRHLEYAFVSLIVGSVCYCCIFIIGISNPDQKAIELPVQKAWGKNILILFEHIISIVFLMSAKNSVFRFLPPLRPRGDGRADTLG